MSNTTLTTTTEIRTALGPKLASVKVQATTIPSGLQFEVFFTNGYGASLINNIATFGVWEIAVLDRFGDLCYSTPITNDVIRLSPDEVVPTLHQISDLPPCPRILPSRRYA